LTPEQEQRGRVCDHFYRADASGKIPGTGLGVSIIKEIIELLGGIIQIESEYGKGTEVILWLPAAPSERATILNSAEITPSARRPA
jgi:signal transduction histidine kinase